MFAAKSLTMEERGAKELINRALALVVMRAMNGKMCRFWPSAASGGVILFKFFCARRLSHEPQDVLDRAHIRMRDRASLLCALRQDLVCVGRIGGKAQHFAANGASLSTVRSASAVLKVENWLPPKRLSTSTFVSSFKAAKIPTRLSASGRRARPSTSLGNGSGSVLARRIFCAIVSASSVSAM